jgi:hypothetical protein
VGDAFRRCCVNMEFSAFAVGAIMMAYLLLQKRNVTGTQNYLFIIILTMAF